MGARDESAAKAAATLSSLTAQRAVKADALRRLAQIRAPHKRYLDMLWPTLPGEPTLPMKLRVLSCTEIAEVEASADAYLRVDLKLDPESILHLPLYQDEIATQILFRACRDAENPELPLAADANDLRDASTADERTQMFDAYQDWRSLIDPSPDLIPEAVYIAMEDAVKKKDLGGLLAFGGRRLANFVISMADRPSISPTPKSASPSGATTRASKRKSASSKRPVRKRRSSVAAVGPRAAK